MSSSTTTDIATGEPGTSSDTSDSSGADTGVSPCGDGILDPGEACDDGNTMAGDGCLPNCTAGFGVELLPLELPPLLDGEFRSCLTSIDAALYGGGAHALVLGGFLYGLDPGVRARVQRVPLPQAHPATWSFTQGAGSLRRYANQAVTAANGDVVVAGHIYIDNIEPDTGILWLLRISPGGEVVWHHDFPQLAVRPSDLALTPTGEILTAGRFAGYGADAKGSWVHAFDPDGVLLWEVAAPIADEWSLLYTGVTADDAGTIYAVGQSSSVGGEFSHVVLQALSLDGDMLWEVETPPPSYPHASTSDIVVTTTGKLVVSLAQSEYDSGHAEEHTLAAYDKEGAHLWWSTWIPAKYWTPSTGPLVAAADGGVFATWAEGQEDVGHTVVARIDPDGELMWSSIHFGDWPGGGPQDATLGPDGLLYVLVGMTAVIPYIP